jgi:hypothetical protein
LRGIFSNASAATMMPSAGGASGVIVMGIVPRNNVEKLLYFEIHVGKWLENAGEIGTTPEQVEALQAKVLAARAAFNAQKAAQNLARARTLAFNHALDEVAVAGSSIIQQIRAAARINGESVYPLAWIPSPAQPSPIAAPGKPHDLRVDLQGTGALALRWKCRNPRGSTGTVYHLARQLAPNGPLAFLGISGSKRFIDETVPAGASQIVYQIQAIRSTAQGPPARFPVNLGGSGRRMGEPMPIETGKPVMIAA